MGSIRMRKVADLLNYSSVDSDFYFGDSDRVVRDVLQFKRNDAHYPALLAKIRAEGFTSPVHAYDESLTDGHHRVAVAVDLGIEEIPVEETYECVYDKPEDWGAEEYGYRGGFDRGDDW